MAIPPALRAPQGFVAPLPGAMRPPLPRARHAVRGRGQGKDHGCRGAEVPRPGFARPTHERSTVQ